MALPGVMSVLLSISLLLASSTLIASESTIYKWSEPSRLSDGNQYLPLTNLSENAKKCLMDTSHCGINGLTLGIWINPVEIPRGKVKYWYTNGGDSPYGYGVFLRQEGGSPARFVLGVSMRQIVSNPTKKSAWIQHPFILKLGQWINVAISWNVRQGLYIFVDGKIFENSISSPKDVLFVNYLQKHHSSFYRNLLVDIPYDGETVTGSERVRNVVYKQQTTSQDKIREVVGFQPQTIGCLSESTDTSKVFQSPAIVLSDATQCQESCSTNEIFAYNDHSECRCISTFATVDSMGFVKCSDLIITPKTWKLYMVTHHISAKSNEMQATVVVKDIDLKVRNRFFTGDPVIFDVEVLYGPKGSVLNRLHSPLYVAVDFVGQSRQLYFNTLLFNTTWSESGNFSVDITVVTELGRVTTRAHVTILDSSGSPVYMANVTFISWLDKQNSGRLHLLGFAIAKGDKTCTIRDSKGTNLKVSEGASYILQVSDIAEVVYNGLHQFFFHCANKYDSATGNTTILVPRVTESTFHISVNDTLKIPLMHAQRYAGHLMAVADSSIPLTIKSLLTDSVEVDVSSVKDDNFAVRLFLDHAFLSQDFVKRYYWPRTSISSDRLTGLPNDTYNVRYELHGRGVYEMDIHDNFARKHVYYRSNYLKTSLRIPHAYTFNKTGAFVLSFRACNRLHCAQSQLLLGPEIPVLRVRLVSENINSTSSAANLQVFINEGTSLPISHCSYEVMVTGQAPAVGELTNSDQNFGPFLIPFQFQRYGMQQVKIRLFNNMSAMMTEETFRIGAPLKQLSVMPQKDHVMVGEDFNFALHLGGGAPLTLTVSLSDGTTYKLPSVNRFDYLSETNKTLTLWAAGTSGNQKAAFAASPDHTKVIGSLFINGPTSPMVLAIRIFKRGHYKVSITAENAFNMLSDSVCREVFVESNRETPCSFVLGLDVNGEIVNNKSITNQMSMAINMKPTVTSRCLKTTELVFDWEIQELGTDGSENKLVFCSKVHEPPLSVIVIAPFQLDYGKYLVSVRATDAGNVVNYASQKVVVHSIPSKLVAQISEEAGGEVSVFSDVVLNFTSSGDPDERNSLESGVTFDILCFLKGAYDGGLSVNLTDFTLAANISKDSGSEEQEVNILDYKDQCFTQRGSISIMNSPSNRTVSFKASDLVNEKTVTFRLIVSDSQGRRVMDDVDVTVVSTVNLKDLMTRLDDFLNTEDQTALLKFVSSASTQLNGTGNASEVQTVVGKMITALDRVSGNLSDYSQVSMCTNALESLTEDPERMTDESQVKAANSMKNTASGVKKFSDQPLSTINGTANTLVRGMSNVVPQKSYAKKMEEEAEKRKQEVEALKRSEEIARNKSAEEGRAAETDDDPGQFTVADIPKGMYDCYTIQEIEEKMRYEHPDEVKADIDACIEKKRAVMEENNAKDKSVSDSVMGAGSVTGDVLLGKTDNMKIKSPKLDMQVDKTVNKDGDKDMSSDFGGISVPKGAIPGSDGAGAQLMSTPDSPFTWAQGINSPVIALTYSNSGGKPIVVKDTPKPINIMIPRKTKPKPVRYYIVTSLGKTEERKMNFHSVTVDQNSSSISLYVKPSDPDDTYMVYVKRADFPNSTFYDYKEIVPRLNATKESNNTEEVQELMYTVTPPAFVTEACGKYTFGVSLWGSRFTDVVSARNFTYDMASYISMCRYFNTTTQEWDTNGVKVGARTLMNQTQCVSNHLTSFGGDFYVPPNTIDFNTVFAKFKDLHENAAVFATVISVICLYFIVLIWARWADRKDVLRWGATHLEDNLPSDSYNYEVTVMTGIGSGSGTSSKISFIFSGDFGDTGVRHLYDGKRKHFPRGSILNFIMSTESNLGQLTFLRIWHDNMGKGKEKSWYLDQIVVTDLQTGDKFFFLNNRWLAVEEDDGMVERIIPVAGYSDLVTFKHLFRTSFTSKMRNDHLWLSIFSRPTRSSFTRVQRVSCCVALLFLTMISNAMFFKAEEKVKPVGITIGRITITSTTLYVSLMSTLIVFPPSLLIVTFFRKCKSKGNQITQENQEMSKASRKYKWRAIDPNSELFQNSQSQNIGVKTKSHTKLWDSLRNILAFHQKTSDEDSMEMGDGNAPQKKKKQPFLFPHWCIYIAWILVFLSVFASAFFVILYSMQWGKEKAEEWLVAFILSFFQSVVVIQPIKVLLLVAFISLVLKKPELDDEEQILDDKLLRPDEELLRKDPVDIHQIQLQRRMATAVMAPPDNKALLAVREQRLKEIAMEAIIKEMATYFIFIMVVFFLSYQTRSTQSYLLHSTIKSTFFSKLSSINTFSDFYKYVNQTLLPGLYADDWYNGRKLTWREALCINDGSYQTVRVGVPRFRQLRVKSNSCKVLKDLSNVIHHCRGSYNWLDDDTKPYYPVWVKPATKEEADKLKKDKESPFVYRSSFFLKGIPYFASQHLYKGGGYVKNFARTRPKSQKIVNELYEQNWVDTRTRAIFIEFGVYNAPSNLFGSVTMVVEFLSSGGATTKAEAKIFRLFSYVGGFGVIVLLMEIIFGLFVLVYLVKEIKTWRQDKKKYFKEFWNILEFATLAISCAAVVMYVFKKILVNFAMTALRTGGGGDEETPEPKPVELVPKVPCPALVPPKKEIPVEDIPVVSGKFVNFGSLATYDELFCFMIGFVVFIATIKFIKILKFNRRMGMLGSTIKLATKDLKSFSVMFFIYFMAFCQAAYLLFGRNILNYSTFISTMEALFSMALGSFDYYALEAAQPVLGPIFFYLFINLVSIGLLGMFLTIINDSFAVVKNNTELQSNDYELVDFMWKRFKNMFGMASMHQTTPAQAKEEEEEGLPPLTNQEKELILS